MAGQPRPEPVRSSDAWGVRRARLWGSRGSGRVRSRPRCPWWTAAPCSSWLRWRSAGWREVEKQREKRQSRHMNGFWNKMFFFYYLIIFPYFFDFWNADWAHIISKHRQNTRLNTTEPRSASNASVCVLHFTIFTHSERKKNTFWLNII